MEANSDIEEKLVFSSLLLIFSEAIAETED